jgi:xylulokinase
VDGAGVVQCRHAVPLDAPLDAEGCSELDPEIWWRALAESAEALSRFEPDLWRRTSAVAISAFTRSQVFVGADGIALRPAILWRDTRSGPAASCLAATLPSAHPETAGLNAFHPLARLAWLRESEPEALARLAHVLEPKDWLNQRLTGRIACDRISMARLLAAAMPGPDGRDLLTAAGFQPSLVPPPLSPVSIMGRVRPGLGGALDKLTGTPVIAMANDTWASVAGLGALRPGFAYNLSGTTEVFGILSEAPGVADGLLTVDWSGGDGRPTWQLGGPSQTGGDSVLWLLELLTGTKVAPKAAGEALERLLATPRDADPVIFLPFLQGERVPFWDASLRGAFIGLGRRHGPADLAFAVLEGIACLNRMVLERAEAAGGVPVREVRFGGGGAANAVWRQIKADILGRPVVSVPGDGHGLAGAALVALTAIGVFPDLHAAQRTLVPAGQTHLPAASAHERADRLYGLFRQACDAVNPLARQLSGWARAFP